MFRRYLRAMLVGPEAVQLRRFFLVGLLAAGFQTGLLGALVEWGNIQYLLAAICSIEVTILLQYGVNNRWTFSAARHQGWREYGRGLLRTNLVRGSAIPIQLGILFGLVSLATVPYLVANGVGIVVSGVYRYVLESRWTWKD
ncbi:Putative flippase GtrA (transmembrane translocase of bactoprenol-linked glucose) [Haloplanus vescus]|uniref:Putative flippase GtrA (Transmembrane translocase of bactoprenol-linked glucose) n=1 Tax=Haloplanus vescus TaxID=555874 RepID=A0A1H3ZCU6_9EURY|nr:GtrA family protein [Haloplanus vescus]SEA21619.1 Putative flippase GtrA (transmembrane translocase of bactoprenol-linked glucose) [Haloplanus vescus]